jgi:hypothetical protein
MRKSSAVIAIALLSAALLTGCASTSSVPIDGPTASLPPLEPAVDGATVTGGQWAVLQASHDSNPLTFALRVTSLRRGTPGAFDKVQNLGSGQSLLPKGATPWFVRYEFVPLTGDADAANPIQTVYLDSSDPSVQRDRDALVTVGVPAELERCGGMKGWDDDPGIGRVGEDCAVAAATSGSTVPETLVFSTRIQGTNAPLTVTFELPKAAS